MRHEVAIIDAIGKLTLGRGTCAVRDKIRELTEANKVQIVLNFEAVTHVDSSMVGELALAFVQVKSRGGALKLVNVSPHVHDLLVISKLHMVFEIYDDEAVAVHSFWDPPSTRFNPGDARYHKAYAG